jgi:hypothetical protein
MALSAPGWLPVNAGAVAGVNVQRPQRASARTNDVDARKARRRLRGPGAPGHGLKSCSPSLPPSRKANRSRSPGSWVML